MNESGSFLETSSTAMTHWAITTAVQQGFLTPRSQWDACIRTLWRGVAATVDATGAVAGVCQGGPIYRNKTDYFKRPHAYEASACGGVVRPQTYYFPSLSRIINNFYCAVHYTYERLKGVRVALGFGVACGYGDAPVRGQPAYGCHHWQPSLIRHDAHCFSVMCSSTVTFEYYARTV